MPRNNNKNSAEQNASSVEKASNSQQKADFYQVAPDPDSVPKPAPKDIHEFDSFWQSKLSEDEHHRFFKPSKTIGHALVGVGPSGQMEARQFIAPGGQSQEDSSIVLLSDIEVRQEYGAIKATAKAPDGTPMVATRSLQIKIPNMDNNSGTEYSQRELLMFSPRPTHSTVGKDGQEIVWWGSSDFAEPKIYRDDLDKETQEELNAELKEKAEKDRYPVRGGRVTVDPVSVAKRTAVKSRRPDQNTVMGRAMGVSGGISAHNHGVDFLDEARDELTETARKTLQKNQDAKAHWRGASRLSQGRLEWLHAIGYKETPWDQEPQQQQNLAGAPKWLNTRQMVGEHVAKWHASHRPADVELDVQFKTIPGTDLLKEGDLEARVEENGRVVEVHQHLNPWVSNPKFNKPTDIAQAVMVTHGLLNDKASIVVPAAVHANVRKQDGFMSGYQRVSAASIGAHPRSAFSPIKESRSERRVHFAEPLTREASRTQSAALSEAGMAQSSSRTSGNGAAANSSALSGAQSSSQPLSHSSPSTSRSDTMPGPIEQRVIPTEHAKENSVVQIVNNFLDIEYETPWKGSEPMGCRGSGVVIERDGQKYILTNAHVVENNRTLTVRLANSDKCYDAKVMQISHQVDLALVRVDAPEFLARAEPVSIGEMAKRGDVTNVVGFPMGGDELSTTEGKVNRIQIDDYAHSGERDINVQTDAAINPGNSGGPVFNHDLSEVVGIAFQGVNGASNLGYMIPPPVINHFLEDYFSPGPYKGFPTVAFDFQPLTNKSLRKFKGLSAGETGVMVIDVDTLSDAHHKLQPYDVITSIDGHKISNDGKVSIAEIGHRIEMDYLFRRKQIGESVSIDVTRIIDGVKHELSFDVELKYRPGQTKALGAIEHDKNPTYFVRSGILFQTLTMNYIETSHGLVLREMITDKGYLHDKPKAEEDDEVVIINRVFNTKVTNGYEHFDNNRVKEINGVAVKNIRHALELFENNEQDEHVIKVGSGELIVVDNLTAEQEKDLVRPYRIQELCSEDLASLIKAPAQAPVERKAAPPKPRAQSSMASRLQEALRVLQEVGVHAEDLGLGKEAEQAQRIIEAQQSSSSMAGHHVEQGPSSMASKEADLSESLGSASTSLDEEEVDLEAGSDDDLLSVDEHGNLKGFIDDTPYPVDFEGIEDGDRALLFSNFRQQTGEFQGANHLIGAINGIASRVIEQAQQEPQASYGSASRSPSPSQSEDEPYTPRGSRRRVIESDSDSESESQSDSLSHHEGIRAQRRRSARLAGRGV